MGKPKPKPEPEPVQEAENVTKCEEETKCAICNTIAQSRCGGCQKVGYCSKEHQKIHWKEHKGECCPWKVTESKKLGRYLVAVRDIKAGEIIIQEKPLLITPPKITLPVCLGCYSEFKLDGEETDDGRGVKAYSCRNNCGWPMCKSSTCSNSKDHESECSIAKARGSVIIRNADIEHPLYQSIGILRALGLKEKDPQALDKLMSLEANTEKRKEFKKSMEAENELPGTSSSKDSDGNMEASVKLILEFFKRSDVSEEWIQKLIGIIETNGHEIPIPNQDGHINRRVIGVYHTSSFLEHNCRPNCVKSWDLRTKEIVIRSSVAIKKGEHLSISYVDPLWGTNDRVNLLRMTKFFTCTCARCEDPTELICHISSLRCRHLKCINVTSTSAPFPKEGMIIPEDPFKPEAQWKCVTCGEDYNASYVSSLVHKAGEELEQLQEKIGDISAKEEYLKRFSKTLSPNHFYLLEVKVELSQLYGRTGDEPLHLLSPRKLLRKIQLCEELLIVLNVIVPGYNRLRALIIYELQAAVFTLSKIRRSVEEISMEKHLEELMQCGKWMSEVIKVLGWESHNSIERKRAAGAERDLDLLRSAVLSLQSQTETPSNEQSAPKSASKPTSTPGIAKAEATTKVGSGGGTSGTGHSEKDTLDDVDISHLSVDDESFIEEVF